MATNTGVRDGVGDRGQREDADGVNGAPSGESGALPRGNADEAGTDYDFLGVVDSAERANFQFLAALQRQAWQQTIRAYRNKHLAGSKYETAPYRNRSKIFRPKVRTAVRKNTAAMAVAMFSTSDVVQVRAEYDTNPIKQASAGIIHQIVNYRLDRTATKSGVPWFLVCAGACIDAQLQAVCFTKQFWEREEVTERHDVIVEETFDDPVYDEATGNPVFNEDGTPVTQERVERRPDVEERTYVTKDRPMVMNVPPEHCILDPGAPWYDPVQLSPYFIAKYPMSIDNALTMLSNPGANGTQWIPLSKAQLEECQEDLQAKSVRIERSGGVDRFDTGSRVDDNQIIWLYECFVRVGGVDYSFWSVGHRYYASTVRTTREAYPEQFGARPYVMGYGQIEPHNIAPMSSAESILPLQIEANDLVNLRMDATKQAISPIAVVRQGVVYDWKQLQHRGAADTTVMVKNIDDLRFEKMPGPDGQSYQEMNLLNVDMDELTGSFAGSSVQANRQLNETVGGMRMLSSGANSITEYDLRVWVETWAEPALRQMVRCIQYYESDEKVFAIAGARAADLFERLGVDSITDSDLESEVSVSINVGIGSADPMQKLQKFGMAMSAISQAAPFMDRKPQLNAEEFIKEAMGNAGYNDGMRFFTFDDGPPQPSPEQIEAEIKAAIEQAKLDSAERRDAAKNQTTLENTNLAGRMSIIETLLTGMMDEQRAARDVAFAREESEKNRAVGATQTLSELWKAKMGFGRQERAEDRRAAAQQGAQA